MLASWRLQDAVQKPFEARQRAGRERLMALLGRIMIRAAKSDLVTIPPCHHKVNLPSYAEAHETLALSIGVAAAHQHSSLQCVLL